MEHSGQVGITDQVPVRRDRGCESFGCERHLSAVFVDPSDIRVWTWVCRRREMPPRSPDSLKRLDAQQSGRMRRAECVLWSAEEARADKLYGLGGKGNIAFQDVGDAFDIRSGRSLSSLPKRS